QQDATAFGEGERLVGHVEQTLLAHHRGEGTTPEGQRLRVPAYHADEAAQSHRGGETTRARGAVGAQIDAGHARAPSAGHEAGGPGEPSAQAEAATGADDACAAPQRSHGLQPAVVILIEVVEILGTEAREILALTAQSVDDLPLAD